jgi:hypothetical protein
VQDLLAPMRAYLKYSVQEDLSPKGGIHAYCLASVIANCWRRLVFRKSAWLNCRTCIGDVERGQLKSG